jgi:putative hemolysin
MNDLPSSTFAFSSLMSPRIYQSLPRAHGCAQSLAPRVGRGHLTVSWARHADEVLQAQRLRFMVFAQEMGARLSTRLPEHDVDYFDSFCEHLLVRDERTGELVATCRVLTPVQARRVGSTYSDLAFDLSRLQGLRSNMVELGRSCVHPDYRTGGVIMILWGALAEFMVRNKLASMMGCASIAMLHNGMVSGDVAASLWHRLKTRHLAPIELHVRPRVPLPIEKLDDHLAVEPPALIKAYLRLGAKILGAPSWDPDFNTADLPMMVCISDLPPRYGKLLLGL